MSDVTIRAPQDNRPGTFAPSRCRCRRTAARARQLALYQRGILSSGKATDLVGIIWWEWEELLDARKIPQHYADEDLDRDNGLCHSQLLRQSWS
ncbi:MAG: UPF0175 family protein [Methanoculleus sp.]